MKITDKQRCQWLTENAGIVMDAWAKHDLFPEWFRDHEVRLIINAAIRQGELR